MPKLIDLFPNSRRLVVVEVLTEDFDETMSAVDLQVNVVEKDASGVDTIIGSGKIRMLDATCAEFGDDATILSHKLTKNGDYLSPKKGFGTTVAWDGGVQYHK